MPPPPAKHHRPTTIKGHKPPKGSHHHHTLKRKEKITNGGQIPRSAIARNYVQNAKLILMQLDASTLPTAHRAHTGKVEDKAEKYRGKKCCSLTKLIAKGFQLVKWNR
jgi:ABC-type Fe3+/spermidine/putrescine transport system ATPase subunit